MFESKRGGGTCSITCQWSEGCKDETRLEVDFSDFTALAVHLYRQWYPPVYLLRGPQVCLWLIPSFTLGMLTGKFCISLLRMKSLSVLCSSWNCQNVNFAFSESWLTQCLFTVFSKWLKNSKQGWQINLGLHYYSLFGCGDKAMGKGSLQMWQMEQEKHSGKAGTSQKF